MRFKNIIFTKLDEFSFYVLKDLSSKYPVIIINIIAGTALITIIMIIYHRNCYASSPFIFNHTYLLLLLLLIALLLLFDGLNYLASSVSGGGRNLLMPVVAGSIVLSKSFLLKSI